jgi:hypothetical protein
MGLLKRFSERRASKKFLQSPFGQALHRHTIDGFHSSILRDLSPEGKQEIVQTLGNKIDGIFQAEEPFLKCREEFGGAAVAYADLQVLCLLENEKAGVPQFQSPYISGELHRHIRKCVPHNEDLKQFVWRFPESTDKDLIAHGNFRCAVNVYYLNGLNLVRKEFKDYDTSPNKDWLQPLLISLLIFYENTYRNKIGLPSLTPTPWDALRHSTMMDLVMSGHSNPLYQWETTNEVAHVKDASGGNRE